jgi:hypothetical protein
LSDLVVAVEHVIGGWIFGIEQPVERIIVEAGPRRGPCWQGR